MSSGANSSISRIFTKDIPSATFTYAPHGNYRKMILALDNDIIVFDSFTTEISSGAPDALPELAIYKVHLQLTIFGNVTLDKGDYSVNRDLITLVAVRNATG